MIRFIKKIIDEIKNEMRLKIRIKKKNKTKKSVYEIVVITDKVPIEICSPKRAKRKFE